MKNQLQVYYTPIQLKMPVDMEMLIEVDDPVYSFNMEEGYQALRKIKKLCRTDIRFLWLLDGTKGPSHVTIGNFINKRLKGKIEDIFSGDQRVTFGTGT